MHESLLIRRGFAREYDSLFPWDLQATFTVIFMVLINMTTRKKYWQARKYRMRIPLCASERALNFSYFFLQFLNFFMIHVKYKIFSNLYIYISRSYVLTRRNRHKNCAWQSDEDPTQFLLQKDKRISTVSNHHLLVTLKVNRHKHYL